LPSDLTTQHVAAVKNKEGLKASVARVGETYQRHREQQPTNLERIK